VFLCRLQALGVFEVRAERRRTFTTRALSSSFERGKGHAVGSWVVDSLKPKAVEGLATTTAARRLAAIEAGLSS
jgi:hypothetical protein